MSEDIGILHPGQMGISVAAAAQRAGHRVWYASEGRSARSLGRAREHGLQDAGSVADLCGVCTILLSVCPPHAAGEVAEEVLAAGGFKGLYLDANAISPQRAVGIGGKLDSAGIRFVDGGIIGGPAWEPGTVLYLSGAEAHRLADCFRDSPLQVSLLGEQIGRASALKMCYAAYSKGTSALLAAILALAEASGLRDDLYGQWDRDGILDPQETENRVRRVTAKAWRFAGEMDEIAATFEAVGLPGGFHRAAGEVYRRMEAFKDTPSAPDLEAVLSSLLGDRPAR